MAKRGYARVAVRHLPACFGELFSKGITKPRAAKVVSAGPIDFPKAGDRSNAYRLVASVQDTDRHVAGHGRHRALQQGPH